MLLFCSEPFAPQRPDPDFQEQWQAALQRGHETALFSFEDLEAGEIALALRRVKPAESPREMIYRGWMLTVEKYSALYEALLSKNWSLVNTPEAYRATHHFPQTYPLLAGRTPESHWIERADLGSWEKVYSCLCQLGSGPAIVKDFVKSRKHDWKEACFIPDLSDEEAARRVVERFTEMQGDSLQGGLVFRRYVQLKAAGQNPLSGMPESEEYRRFYLDGQCIGDYAYWVKGLARPCDAPELDTLARQVPSRFFTLDYARTESDDITVIELGDGQVAGLPPGCPPLDFYQKLSL